MYLQYNSIKYSLYLALLISVTSCSNKKNAYREEGNKGNAIEIAVSKSDKSLILDDSLYQFSIIKPDSTQLVAEVSKLLKTGDHFYILDKKSNSLFCLNEDGAVKWKYNKVGRGPEDHDKLVDFSFRNGKIYLFDKLNKILVLDSTGHFISKNRIPYQQYRFLANFMFVNEFNDVVTYNFDVGEKEDITYKVIVLDSTLSKIKHVYLKKHNGNHEKLWTPTPFPMQTFTNNNGFYYTEALNDTIYSYRGDSLQREYVINFGKYTAPASFRKKKNLSLSDFWNSPYGSNISAVLDADSILTFKTQIAGRPYYHFYDKRSGKTATFNNILLKNKDYYAIVDFIGGEGSRLFFTVEPFAVLDAYKYFRNVKYKSLPAEEFDALLKKQYPLFSLLLKDINIYSNQMILSIDVSKTNLFNTDKHS
jgi:hypothetical protein